MSFRAPSFLDFLSSKYPPTLTVEQVSEITSEHPQTIRNMVSQKRYHVPSFKVGRKRLFRLTDVASFIDRQFQSDPGQTIRARPKRGRPTKIEQMARRQAANGANAATASNGR